MPDSLYMRFLKTVMYGGVPPNTDTGRGKQITQYQNPDQDILPLQPLRPQSLTKFQDQPFRSMKEEAPYSYDLGDEYNKYDPKKITSPRPAYPQVLDPGAHGVITGPGVKDMAQFMGMGRAKESVGVDESGKPYLSTFDSWDFAPNDDDAGFLTSQIRKTGKPYNLYDRYPLQLDSQGRINQIQYPRRHPDVNLPLEGSVYKSLNPSPTPLPQRQLGASRKGQ